MKKSLNKTQAVIKIQENFIAEHGKEKRECGILKRDLVTHELKIPLKKGVSVSIATIEFMIFDLSFQVTVGDEFKKIANKRSRIGGVGPQMFLLEIRRDHCKFQTK